MRLLQATGPVPAVCWLCQLGRVPLAGMSRVLRPCMFPPFAATPEFNHTSAHPGSLWPILKPAVRSTVLRGGLWAMGVAYYGVDGRTGGGRGGDSNSTSTGACNRPL